MREFHIALDARLRYQFDDALFQFTGNAVIADLQAARRFAHRMNERRDRKRFPERIVRASDVYALGLIDEIAHFVARLYDEVVRAQLGLRRSVFAEALDHLRHTLGEAAVNATLHAFTQRFPPLAVYRGTQSVEDYLAEHSAEALEELLMLWLENANPAFKPFAELFEDTALREHTPYAALMEALRAYFEQLPPFGPDNQPLIEMLLAPARVAPDSLEAQLAFIQQRWAPFFGEAFSRFLHRLLLGFDAIREDQKALLAGGLGPGPTPVLTLEALRGAFATDDLHIVEYEAFSPDRDWMPRLVLIAKNTYVWLDQLSRKYGRAITRLDQIPDEELDQLARWGITGIWLIGVWERSRASQRIKHLMGDHEALASAYAIYDYVIAEDLGGEAALENLKARAWQRGIRLASDMVPNHMGIDSRWVIERPDYFLSLPEPPFPSYTFNGPNLCDDPRVGIFIEDHYYTRTDAAVVFKRVDFHTGEVRYIYHGNDGTATPWNDTAQINYLNPEAREAVMQAILRVARLFPIIRFDAAMTLVKRHIRRLWFPAPGEGGAIPSRAGHGMSAEAFERLMPNEFWREVVDRVAREAPDTLLLAEAFWLLEGYFVRTLGMHRVYNSAFMNMLRDENNAGYRSVIKNTIEFDPEVLRRYVNFLNNPDEKTAVEQFGKGDKYFGVTTLMCTMPGLPMFGHGQIEGFAEKYGMEFRRARWQETPDADLIARHEREIFPLLRRRHWFAGVERFRLYDCFTDEGVVNEDVFAYSNCYVAPDGSKVHTLVLYHNRFATARGWIRTSAAFAEKDGQGKRLVQSTLGEALELTPDDRHFVWMRDFVSGMEYLHSSRELSEKGLRVELNAYERRVFLDIREVVDDAEHPYSELHRRLNGRGVPSIERALRRLRAEPILNAYRDVFAADWMQRAVRTPDDPALLTEREPHLLALLQAIKAHVRSRSNERRVLRTILNDLRALASAYADEQWAQHLPATEEARAMLIAWAITRRLGELVSFAEGETQSHRWMREWVLDEALRDALLALGLSSESAQRAAVGVGLIMEHRALVSAPAQVEAPPTLGEALAQLFADPDARLLLGVNTYQGVEYFNKEAFEWLVERSREAAAAEALMDAALEVAALQAQMQHMATRAATLIAQAAEVGYRTAAMLETAKAAAST
ncbi:MAG: alpha-amylase family glycosyl hydrolase [Anaerolineae bacterium]|nr:alpha-amylase family glycosyl hydrolase [Anaerolineae bacterium]